MNPTLYNIVYIIPVYYYHPVVELPQQQEPEHECTKSSPLEKPLIPPALIPSSSSSTPRRRNRREFQHELKFKGYHPTSPSNDATCRIRIWQDSLNLHYYDCECGERKPVSDLYKIKQHVKRHQVTEFQMRIIVVSGLFGFAILNSVYGKICLINHSQYCGIDTDLNSDDCVPEIPKLNFPGNGLELVQVFTFARHGDRTFLDNDDCWFELEDLLDCVDVDLEFDSKKKCEFGYLTRRGFEQEVINGKMLRNAYSKILPRNLDNQIFVQSTNVSRTITSAQAVLFGMFGEANEIPRMRKFPILKNWSSIALSGENIAKAPTISSGIKQFFHSIDQPVDSASLLLDYFDCININYCHNQSFHANETSFDLVQKFAAEIYGIDMTYPSRAEYSKYSVGPLLNWMNSQMKNAISSPDLLKDWKRFYLTLGHDTGPMLPLLSALNVWDGKWTPYSSRIIFELYRDPNHDEFFIRMLYNEQEMQIPGCSGTICKYAEWIQLTQPMISTK